MCIETEPDCWVRCFLRAIECFALSVLYLPTLRNTPNYAPVERWVAFFNAPCGRIMSTFGSPKRDQHIWRMYVPIAFCALASAVWNATDVTPVLVSRKCSPCCVLRRVFLHVLAASAGLRVRACVRVTRPVTRIACWSSRCRDIPSAHPSGLSRFTVWLYTFPPP